MNNQTVIEEQVAEYQKRFRSNESLTDYEVEGIITRAVEAARKLPTETNSECPVCGGRIVLAIADCIYSGVPVKFNDVDDTELHRMADDGGPHHE